MTAIVKMNRLTILLQLLLLLLPCLLQAQAVVSFEGIDASQVAHPGFDVDPNGAVGTKQFMEWTNVYYQAYDKKTVAPVWSTPQVRDSTLAHASKMSDCYSISGDGVIIFDRLASRWVIAWTQLAGRRHLLLLRGGFQYRRSDVPARSPGTPTSSPESGAWD